MSLGLINKCYLCDVMSEDSKHSKGVREEKVKKSTSVGRHLFVITIVLID